MRKIKMKSKRCAMKRFKVTGSGRVKFAHAFKNHILTNKSRKSKRQKKGLGVMGTTDGRKIRKLIGAG